VTRLSIAVLILPLLSACASAGPGTETDKAPPATTPRPEQSQQQTEKATPPATTPSTTQTEPDRDERAEQRRTDTDGPITPDWFDPELTESPNGFYATCAMAEGGSLRTVRGVAMQFAKRQLFRIPKAPDPTRAEYEILQVATHRSPGGRYTVWLMVEIRPLDP